MIDRTNNGRVFKVLTLIDKFTRENLDIKVNRKITYQDVIDELFNLFIFRVIAEDIRSDNGPVFATRGVRRWLNWLGVKTIFLSKAALERTTISNSLVGN
jgi:putative transposase